MVMIMGKVVGSVERCVKRCDSSQGGVKAV